MGISNRQNLDAVNTVFEKAINTFIKVEPSHDFNAYARTLPIDGSSLELPFLSSLPVLQDWVVNKVYQALTANTIKAPVVMKAAATSIPIQDINGDRLGIISETLSAFVSRNAQYREQVAFDKLIAGFSDPGYDGVSYFNTSHVDPVTGDVQSNTTTSALTEATFNAACAAMWGFKDNGVPLGITPRKLMVGPAEWRNALQLCQGDLRLIAVDNAGAESGTRVAAAAPTNVMKSWGVMPVLNPRLVGTYDNYWFLIDDSNPMVRPVIMGEQNGGPKPTNDLAQYHDQPEIKFSIEYGVAPCFGPWQVAYGANVS